MSSESQHPVLIAAPVGRDASVLASVLEASGIEARVCAGLDECRDRIAPSTAALLLTEEALELPPLRGLMDVLESQPEWSDLPLIVLVDGGEERVAALLDLFAAVRGTVRLMERPTHAVTLVNAVQVALRSRQRQYQVRNLLEQQQRHKTELEQALSQRTRELNQSYEAMRRSETMAVLGAMSTGIVHDLTNLLLPLQARLDLLAPMPLSPEVREDLQVIERHVEYLRALARRLRQYMPGYLQAGEPVDVAIWCRDTLPFYRGVLPSHVTLQADVPRTLPALKISQVGLTQAVYNLVQNAAKAIARTGIGSRVTLRAAPAEGQVTISVEDDGPGMAPDVLARCLDRSFTTSAASGSMGWGLSMVRGFVESWGGTLEVHSPPAGDRPVNAGAAPRHGAEFVMRLPVAGALSSSSRATSESRR